MLSPKSRLFAILLGLACTPILACEADRGMNYGHRRRHLFFRTHRGMFSPLDTLNVPDAMIRDLDDIRYKKLQLKYYTAKQWQSRMAATPEVERRAKFRMRPGSTFEMDVRDEPELSGRYVVGPDGTINISLIRDPIYLEGKTFEESRDTIRNALKSFIRNPEIILNAVLLRGLNEADEFKAGQALIFGSLGDGNASGEGGVSGAVVSLTGKTSFLEFIASTGGVSGKADMQNIVILRRIEGEINVIIVDFQRLYQFGDLGQDIQILDGDILLMPERENSLREQFFHEWNILLQVLTGLVTWDFAIEQFKDHNFLTF